MDLRTCQMKKLKYTIKKTPLIGTAAKRIARIFRKISIFPGSREYWEGRYDSGGTSGLGAYGQFAEFKAEVINSFVRDHKVSSVVEFGCGDGNQLALAHYPNYIGLDVSRTAIMLCKERFKDDKTKSFFLYDSECFVDIHSVFRSELSLSLDVIYHLVEDRIFELYLNHLFSAAEKFVIIYSSDTDDNPSYLEPQIRNRCFSKWVEKNFPQWNLKQRIPNKYPLVSEQGIGSFADFFIYEKR